MSAQPSSSDTTRRELRAAIYDKFKNHGLPVGFLDNPKHWQYFNDALDGVMALLATERSKVIDEVEAILPEKQYNDILKLKNMTTWQRMKARVFVKSHNQTVDSIRAALKRLKEMS